MLKPLAGMLKSLAVSPTVWRPTKIVCISIETVHVTHCASVYFVFVLALFVCCLKLFTVMSAPGPLLLREIEIRLATGISASQLRAELERHGTPLSLRTCERYRATYLRCGPVLKPPELQGLPGRPRALGTSEQKVILLLCIDLMLIHISI